MGDFYLLVGPNLGKCKHSLENGRFSGRVWPDRDNTAWADMG